MCIFSRPEKTRTHYLVFGSMWVVHVLFHGPRTITVAALLFRTYTSLNQKLIIYLLPITILRLWTIRPRAIPFRYWTVDFFQPNNFSVELNQLLRALLHAHTAPAISQKGDHGCFMTRALLGFRARLRSRMLEERSSVSKSKMFLEDPFPKL
jgi:hypothetical protein